MLLLSLSLLMRSWRRATKNVSSVIPMFAPGSRRKLSLFLKNKMCHSETRDRPLMESWLGSDTTPDRSALFSSRMPRVSEVGSPWRRLCTRNPNRGAWDYTSTPFVRIAVRLRFVTLFRTRARCSYAAVMLVHGVPYCAWCHDNNIMIDCTDDRPLVARPRTSEP